jgi:hypothetical protein
MAQLAWPARRKPNGWPHLNPTGRQKLNFWNWPAVGVRSRLPDAIRMIDARERDALVEKRQAMLAG